MAFFIILTSLIMGAIVSVLFAFVGNDLIGWLGGLKELNTIEKINVVIFWLFFSFAVYLKIS